MASIPEMLKEAYNSKNWSIVSDVYFNLTGTRLMDGIYNPKQDFISPKTEQKYEMPQSPNNKKYARTEAIDLNKSKFNMFVDNGTEAVEDKAIDKILCKNGPVPKINARPSEMVNVICKKCKKTITVSESLAKRNFICNDCIGHP